LVGSKAVYWADVTADCWAVLKAGPRADWMVVSMADLTVVTMAS
jgi:hypothetical protein